MKACQAILAIGLAAILALSIVRPGAANLADDCERLAAPLVEFEPRDPIPHGNAVADGAVVACAEALRLSPSDPRLSLLFGLVLIAHDQAIDGFVYVERAAYAGDTSAEFLVGVLHRADLTPWSTPTLALQWFERAAHKGHADAQFSFGLMHRGVIDGTRNPELTAFWVEQAADQGHAYAKTLLGTFYRDGEGVEKSLDRAMALLHEAVGLGDPTAQHVLGSYYVLGLGVERHVATGLELLEMAAEQGDTIAMIELGEIHLAGRYVLTDPAKGVAWYCKAGADGALYFRVRYDEQLSCE